MKTKTQHKSNTGIKRKLEVETKDNKTNKVPHKGELVIQLKDTQEKYEKLEDASNKHIEILKTENKNLKQRIQDLEEENKIISKPQSASVQNVNVMHVTLKQLKKWH